MAISSTGVSVQQPHQVQQAVLPQPNAVVTPQQPLLFGGADSVEFNVVPKQPLFGSKLDRNPSVGYQIDSMIDYFQMAQAQRALTQQSLALTAQGDTTSHVTFYADMHDDLKWPAMLNGLVDAIYMTDRPVDVALRTDAGPMALKMLVSATGNRYMLPEARLDFGEPIGSIRGTQKNMNNRQQIVAEDIRTLEWEIMQVAGVSSREQVSQDLRRKEEFNPLMALAYGSKGLINAVIVGEDELLTRNALERFASANLGAGGDLQAFIRKPDSLDKVTAWAREQGLLQSFSDTAITAEPMKLGKTVLDKDDKDKKTDDKKDGDDAAILETLKTLLKGHPQLLERLTGTAEGKDAEAKDEDDDEDKGKFQVHGYKDLGSDTSGDKVTPTRHKMLGKKPSAHGTRLELQNVPEGYRHAYGRDAIFFATDFNFEVMQPMTDALRRIIEKKEAQQKAGLPVSNGLIVENSPGGYIMVLNQWLGLLNTTDVPFDVVVQGWGTSCGSMLLNGATGNRFVTPNGHSLIHQLSAGSRDYPAGLEVTSEALNRQNKRLRYLISERSGRPQEEVMHDMQADLDLNAMEMMLYGSKGFVDAILVGPDKVLTREAVFEFVADRVGGADKVEGYVNERLARRRLADDVETLRDHKEVDADPLANPVAAIKTMVAQGKAVPIDSVPQFENSLGDAAGVAEKTIDYYDVTAVDEDDE